MATTKSRRARRGRRLRRPAPPGQGLPRPRRDDAPGTGQGSPAHLGGRPIGTRRRRRVRATLGGMNEVATRYHTLADTFERRLHDVAPDQWSNQTPCTEWTVRDLVGHVVGTHGMMLGFIGRSLSSAPTVEDDP